MHSIEFPGSRWIGPAKSMGDSCYGIYAQPVIDNVDFPFWITCWQPSAEDKEAIAAGRPIYFQMTTGAFKDPEGNIIISPLIPSVPFTLDDNGESNQTD